MCRRRFDPGYITVWKIADWTSECTVRVMAFKKGIHLNLLGVWYAFFVNVLEIDAILYFIAMN